MTAIKCYRCNCWPCECRDNQTIICGDCRPAVYHLPDEYAQCCVTSPPYWGLRDYGNDSQLGLEKTPDEYVADLVEVFRDVRRVLRNDGTVWLNLGDSYTSGGRTSFGDDNPGDKQHSHNSIKSSRRAPQPPGLKPKDLCGIPWRVAFALQADGWYLRQDIIWHKPNPMPESVTDRCTKSHEYIFLLSKSQRYYYDAAAIAEPATYAGQMRGGSVNRYEQNTAGMDSREYATRNKRSVWTVNPKSFKGAHFATFPPDLIEPCIKAGCPEGGTVLDPFLGSGTTSEVCRKLGRKSVGIELNENYCKLAMHRLRQEVLDFEPELAEVTA